MNIWQITKMDTLETTLFETRKGALSDSQTHLEITETIKLGFLVECRKEGESIIWNAVGEKGDKYPSTFMILEKREVK